MRSKLSSYLGGKPPRPNGPTSEARARAEASVAALLAAAGAAFLRAGRHAAVAFRVDGSAVQPVALGDDPRALAEARALLGGADAVVAVRERGGRLEAVVERSWVRDVVRRAWPIVRGHGPLHLGEPSDGAFRGPRLLTA